jgi:transcriptional regulator
VTIYIPPSFAGDATTGRQLIADDPFATLITTTTGAPYITHLPLLLDGSRWLIGHMARANPHWQKFADGDTVAVFHGPHAFVSRGWYENPADNVPTWNYAAVHVSGKPALADAAATREAVERLAARFEPPALAPIAEEKLQRLLQGIVAFRMLIARLEVKFKMSQNKAAADRAGVIAGLRASGRPEDLATADWMQSHG